MRPVACGNDFQRREHAARQERDTQEIVNGSGENSSIGRGIAAKSNE